MRDQPSEVSNDSLEDLRPLLPGVVIDFLSRERLGHHIARPLKVKSFVRTDEDDAFDL